MVFVALVNIAAPNHARADDAAPDPESEELEALRQRIEALEALLLDRPLAEVPPSAEEVPPPVDVSPPVEAPPLPPLPPISIEFHGYGEARFGWLDYSPDPTTEGGSAADSRGVFDLARLSLEVEVELGAGFEVEAEVEFEHGGTGTELELEYEEFGEYEIEVSKGGEVVLEELYLAKAFGEHVSLKIGRFYVPVGLLYDHHRPLDYLGGARPESETTLLSGVWDEMGIAARLRHGGITGTVMVASGLDSTGFSSATWIGGGQQGRFELLRVRAPAIAGRIDVRPLPGVVFGGSIYAGDTSGGRPKADMQGIPAPLLIASGHAAANLGPLRARFSLVWGHLWNAGEISEKNRRLSNNLGVPRTAVAEEALSVWSEVGVNVLAPAALAHRLEPFVRVEHYDTMLAPGKEIFDNPRYERTVLGGGLAWSWRGRVGLTLDLTHRRFGSPDRRPETSVHLASACQF